MKNYVQMTRIRKEHWEDCKDWRANRLQFLLSMRENFRDTYLENKLGEEKEDFYTFSPETLKMIGL